MDAKKTGQQELTIGVSKEVDQDKDISIISSKRLRPVTTIDDKTSDLNIEKHHESAGSSKDECTQKSTTVARGYIRFRILPEKMCIDPQESKEPTVLNPNNGIPFSGYVPLKGIMKQQNDNGVTEK